MIITNIPYTRQIAEELSRIAGIVTDVVIGAHLLPEGIIGQYTDHTVVVDVGNIYTAAATDPWPTFSPCYRAIIETVRCIAHELSHAAGHKDEATAVKQGDLCLRQFFYDFDIPKDMLSSFGTTTNEYVYWSESLGSLYSVRDVVYNVEFHQELWPRKCRRIDLGDAQFETDLRPNPVTLAETLIATKTPEEEIFEDFERVILATHQATPTPTSSILREVSGNRLTFEVFGQKVVRTLSQGVVRDELGRERFKVAGNHLQKCGA